MLNDKSDVTQGDSAANNVENVLSDSKCIIPRRGRDNKEHYRVTLSTDALKIAWYIVLNILFKDLLRR